VTLVQVVPLVLIVLVFYLLILRPQRRRQQTMSATQAALRVGTEVMLGSGIYGRVASVDAEETTILVEVAPGTVVKVARQAVIRIIEPVGDDPAALDGPDGAADVSPDAPPEPGEAGDGRDERRGPDQP
jgi:preprotein translocase subunit YajC